MTRTYVTKTEQFTRKYFDNKTCDLCGKSSTLNEFDWASGYKIDEIEIRRKTGLSYPDSGWGEEYTVDMCPECWDGKFLPWLKEQGAVPNRTEWDW